MILEWIRSFRPIFTLLFLHYGRVYQPFIFIEWIEYKTIGDMCYQFWRSISQFLSSKVQCFRLFLSAAALLPLRSSRVYPDLLSNWPVDTPHSQQIVSALRSNPHAPRKISWVDSSWIKCKLVNSFFDKTIRIMSNSCSTASPCLREQLVIIS